MPSERVPAAEYVRQLEDACLALWHELPTEQVLLLREEMPRLMDFLAHLHHAIEHEQAMVRQSVWAEPESMDGGCACGHPAWCHKPRCESCACEQFDGQEG